MAVILEQYEAFVNENRPLLESDFVEFFKNDAVFKEYIQALSEALDPSVKSDFEKVAFREREVILTEAGNLTDGAGRAWAVMYFPILADIYQSAPISKILTTFTTSQARVSLPRRIIKGEIIGLDGTTQTVVLPSSKAVRPDKQVRTISEGKTNLISAIDTSLVGNASINKRYFAITKLTVNDTDANGTTTVDIPVVIRADFSGNFSGNGSFTTKDGYTATLYVSGNVNYDTGDVILNVTIDNGGSADTIEFQNATVEYRVKTIGVDLGKVNVKVDVEDTLQIVLDEDNAFVISLQDEQIQDFKDIYDIDVLATLLDVVKLQFQLNKDYDAADALKLAEPDMKTYGNTASVDFNSLPASLSPANMADIYSLVVPKILKVANNIQRVAHVQPQYLVTDHDTALVLETLQTFASSRLNTVDQGAVGPTAQALQYTRFNIIKSDAVESGKIYVVYKANVKSAAALVDIVYKPLYVHKSDSNGIAKQYLKSRTAVELVDARKVGVVTVANY